MKKILIFMALFGMVLTLKTSALTNPWTDCGDDISLGAKHAGFNFPIRVENYSVRAMKDMMEITFPYKKQLIMVRKSQIADSIPEINGTKDISGVYGNFPVKKSIKLKNGVVFNIKGRKNKFNVAEFGAESGYYSIYSKKGLRTRELNYFYKLLEEAEATRYDYELEKLTLEQLMDSRRVDEIVEPVYSQDCFPRTLQKRGVTNECFERANLGDDSSCSASQIKIIKEYYKKGQDKDPLNDGSGNFCAVEPY